MEDILFFLYIIAGILGSVVFILLGWIIGERILGKREPITRSFNLSLYKVKMPKTTRRESSEEERKEEKNLIAAMEQFFAVFSSFGTGKMGLFKYGPPYVALEIAVANLGEEISFYLAVPIKYEQAIIKQLYGVFPDVTVEKAQDYNIFNPSGVSRGSYLYQSKNVVIPIKTFQEMEVDSLNPLVTALSQLKQEGEGVALQIIVAPAPKGWQWSGQKIIKEISKGESLSSAQAKATQSRLMKEFKFARDVITKKESENKPDSNKPKTEYDANIEKLISNKISKLGFSVNIRILASAGDETRAESILGQVEGAFNQFGSSAHNSFKVSRTKGKAYKKLVFDFSFRLFNKSHAMVLTTDELTSIYHFYTGGLEAPKVGFSKVKLASPPPNLPKQGLRIGKNVFRGQETLINMTEADRYRHLYVVGQTGTGKSGMLVELARQDIINGNGLCVVDPHGDLVEKLLGHVPKERLGDVIYFDPGNLERPMGINMLEFDPAHPEQKTFIINELISIFDKLYNLKETGGPMFEQYFRNAVNLVMDDPESGSTLMEITRVFTDEKYRAYKLAKTSNIPVINFWKDQAEKAGGEAELRNIVPYIVSKTDVFITNDYMRPIIGQQKSAFNFRQVMDNKKILLVNLAKGRLGDINANLLGLIIVGRLLIAALSRTDIAEDQRTPFYLYIDEFQNFSTDSIATILSEARKYRLALIIAHQFIAQLREEIRDAVFGNIGSIVSFRVGADDAEFLEKQFTPVFNKNDLIGLDNRNAYLKLLIEGATSRPFSIVTMDFPKSNPDAAKVIKDYSATKYGKDRASVEKEISARLLKKWSIAPDIAPNSGSVGPGR